MTTTHTTAPTEGTPIQRAIVALNVVKPTREATNGATDLEIEERTAALELALAVCGAKQFLQTFGLSDDQSARLAETLTRWLDGWKKTKAPKPPKQFGLREFFSELRVSGPLKSAEGLTLLPTWVPEHQFIDESPATTLRMDVVVSNSSGPLEMSRRCKQILGELRSGGYGPESGLFLRPEKRTEACDMLDRWTRAWFSISKKYEDTAQFGQTGTSAKPIPAAKAAKKALRRVEDAKLRQAMRGK